MDTEDVITAEKKLSFLSDYMPPVIEKTEHVENKKELHILRLSHEEPQSVIKGTIYLLLDATGQATMTELDKALKAIKYTRGKSRVYWRGGERVVYPIFNYVTLSTVLCMMSTTNNIFYIIKRGKGPSVQVESSTLLYNVDPDDRKLILSIPSYATSFTCLDETQYRELNQVIRGEHLPPIEDVKLSTGNRNKTSDKEKKTREGTTKSGSKK